MLKSFKLSNSLSVVKKIWHLTESERGGEQKEKEHRLFGVEENVHCVQSPNRDFNKATALLEERADAWASFSVSYSDIVSQ